MAVNKIEIKQGSEVIAPIDLTQDTVTANDVMSGVTFHLPNGEQAIGQSQAIIPEGTINITTNGITDVSQYENAEVNVQPNLQNKQVTITTNETQTYTADNGYDGLASLEVTTDVPSVQPNLGIITATVNNQSYYASQYGFDGFSEVVVQVPGSTPTLTTKYIDQNGTYYASNDGADGYSYVEVNVQGASANPYLEVLNKQGSSYKGFYLFAGNSSEANLNQYINNELASNIKRIEGMFKYCSKVTSLDISGFTNITNSTAIYMFSGCNRLTQITWGNSFPALDSTTDYMFQNCRELRGGFDFSMLTFTNNAVSRMGMFRGCSGFTSLILPEMGCSDCHMMFFDCVSLTTLQLSRLYIASGVDIINMFANCTELTTVTYQATKQDFKTDIGDYAILFDANNLSQATITVQCTDGQLVYNNDGSGTFSITENSTTV